MQNKQFLPLIKFLCMKNCCFFLFIICLFLFFEAVFAWFVFLCYKNLFKNFQNCPDSLNYYTTLLNILLFILMSFENLWRQAFQSESRVESKKTFGFSMHINFLSRYLFILSKLAEIKTSTMKLSDGNVA